MAYTINRTNGSVLTTVSDGTINNSTSLTLVGKNFTGYGEFLNENFVRLLENFRNDVAPPSAIEGQLWWNSSNNRLQIYTSTGWRTFATSTVAGTPPVNPTTGDFWWDTTTGDGFEGRLRVWNGNRYVLVGPTVPASGVNANTTVEPATYTSAGGTNPALRFVIGGSTVAIFSAVPTYTPTPAIPGFPTEIRPGLNLSTAFGGNFANGVASDSQRLGGFPAADYVRTGSSGGTSAVTFAGSLSVENDAGLTLGSNRNIRLVVNGVDGELRNITASGDLNLSVNQSGTQRTVVNIDGTTAAVLPGANATHDLGSSAIRWRDVFAGTFNGTATSARYADLAERYEIDSPQTPGTLVKIGGTKEITTVLDEHATDVFGVISDRPAFLMNKDAGPNNTHPAVALAGRVRVRVKGSVSKGQQLVSAGSGLAKAKELTTPSGAIVIGRALETRTTADPNSESLVECVVKFSV